MEHTARIGAAIATDVAQHDVLVIDDDYGARLQVELALMSSTIARVVANATNGARGAELAAELQPDAIVLDLAMPVMDGWEALPLLRKVSPNSAILVRSSNDDDADRERVLELGAKGFIPKFTSIEELRNLIELTIQATEDAHRLIREAVGRIEQTHRLRVNSGARPPQPHARPVRR